MGCCFLRAMSTLEEERAAWVVYSNIHILKLGGVPDSKDMKQFAPNLWKEQTASAATYFVWNDAEMDHEKYIKQTASIGHFIKGSEPTEVDTREDARTVNDGVDIDDFEQRHKCWKEAMAKGRSWRPGSMSFDTSGLSCHGIVPRPPPRRA